MAIPKIREQIEARVKDTGDTMTGLLTLSGNPTADFHAATKKYVDDNTPDVANAALKLTTNAGSSTLPVYFADGIPKQCNTSLGISITGNAATATFATKATQDGNGANIASTYLKLSGGTMTGPIDMNVGTGLSMAYESGKDTPWIYPKGATGYGIRYLEGTPDKMMISASGNNTTAGGADLCINGNGEGTVTIRGNTILHAGNYNSYSPTKTGGGASGTWPISISGNASTANSSSNSSKLNGLSDTAFKRTWSAYAGKDYVGWLKLIEWKVDTAGHFNPQPFIFEICRSYNSPSPESYIIAFTSSWGSGELVQLNGAIGHRIIEQFRISCDSSRTTYWFEMYVNTSYTTYQNGCGCSVFGYYSFDGTLLESIKQTASVSTVTSLTTGRGIISIAGTDYTTYRTRNIASNTGALTSGSTALASGYIYLQYK